MISRQLRIVLYQSMGGGTREHSQVKDSIINSSSVLKEISSIIHRLTRNNGKKHQPALRNNASLGLSKSLIITIFFILNYWIGSWIAEALNGFLTMSCKSWCNMEWESNNIKQWTSFYLHVGKVTGSRTFLDTFYYCWRTHPLLH